MNHDRTTCSTRRNNELEISYQTCVGKGRRLALCIWNEVFTGLPAGNDMQRQNDLRREIIPSWRSPSFSISKTKLLLAAHICNVESHTTTTTRM